MAHVQSGGTYKLINAKGGTVLDLSGGDNRSIIGYGFHGGDNQKVRTCIQEAALNVDADLFDYSGSWSGRVKATTSGIRAVVCTSLLKEIHEMVARSLLLDTPHFGMFAPMMRTDRSIGGLYLLHNFMHRDYLIYFNKRGPSQHAIQR